MLCLTRKPGDKITIGEHITITVVEIANGRAVVGIDAPRNLAIHRDNAKNTTPPEPGKDAA